MAPGRHEIAAQAFYLPWVVKLLKAAGADVAIAVPELASTRFPIAQDQVPATEHVMGGMRDGRRSRTSVTDAEARHHHLDNLFVADGSRLPIFRRAQPDPHDHGDGAAPGDDMGGRSLSRRGGRTECNARLIR